MNQDWTDRLRHKMADFEESPSEGVWKVIEAHTRTAAKRPVLLPVMLAMAACLIGVLLISPLYKSSDVPEKSGSLITAQSSAKSGQTSGNITENNNVTSINTIVSHSNNQSLAAVNTQMTSDRPQIPESSSETGHFSTTTLPEDIKEAESTTKEVKDTAAETQAATQLARTTGSDQNQENSSEYWSNIGNQDETPRTKKNTGTGRNSHNNGIALSLSASGTTGSRSSRELGNSMIMGANMLEGSSQNATWATDKISSYAPLADIYHSESSSEKRTHHFTPVSIGISARIPMSGKLSLETGLNYTKTRSQYSVVTTKQGQEQRMETDVAAHYIGVPLNLVWSFHKSRFLNVYASAGGMIEKGLKADIRKEEYRDNSSLNVSSEKIKGLDYSVNANAGLQVNLFKGLGIYAEPGVSYHFRNGQTEIPTTYMERPLNFRLSFGVRYSFDRR